MRIDEFLDDFSVHGETGEGSFRASDVKVLSDEKWVHKVKANFSRTPYRFNLYIFNGKQGEVQIGDQVHRVKNIDDYATLINYAGAHSAENFQAIVGKVPENASQAINIMLVENEATPRVPLTPWIVIHRIVHSMLFAGHYDVANGDLAVQKKVQLLYSISNHEILPRLYRMVTGNTDYPPWEKLFYDKTIVNEIAHTISTFGSARNKQVRDFGEYRAELFTQYIVYGEIKFKKDAQLHDVDDYDLDRAAFEWKKLFDGILNMCVGKFFIL